MTTTRTTNIQVSKSELFSSCLIDETKDYITSRDFIKDELPYGVTLYMRMRYHDPEQGDSPWSSSVQFQVMIPATIIGVCMDNSTTKGTFTWIDALGNKLDEFNFKNHPTYANIAMVTTDASRAPVTLTRFPLFYVKTAASGPVGTFAAGKKCWWISDIPQTGFRPAACFKRSTSKSEGKYVIAPYCYMGTFLSHQETAGGKTVLGSKRSQTVSNSQTISTLKTWITNRNNASAGQSGYRMFDIWDLGALRLLSLIAKANADTQTCWGDNSAGTTYPKTGSTNARMVFRGSHSDPQVSIEDLWRCYWYPLDLITITNGVVQLFSPMDLKSTISFGSAATSRYTQPTGSGWIRDILDCPFTIGDDTHDLMELFIPKTVVSSESQGTFSDYHQPENGNQIYPDTGGAWNLGMANNNTYTPGCGLFVWDDLSASMALDNEGCRLSKN